MANSVVSNSLTLNLGANAPIGALLPANTSPQRTSKSRQRSTEPANELHAAARQYHQLGLPITLCSPGGKAPITKEWPNHKWTRTAIDMKYRDQPTLNVGLVLGSCSGLVDFDCDGEAAEETFAKLFDGEVIDTPTWRSRRGQHRLFKWHPALEQLNKSKLKLGGDGAELEVLIGPAVQTLLPPSWSDQFRREWVEDLFTVEVAAIPDFVLRKLGCCLDVCAVAREEYAPVLCQVGGGVYRDTETASVSLLSLYALSLCKQDEETVTQAIQATRPTSTGHRQRCLFNLARHLKAIPALAEKKARELRPIVEAWHQLALPTIATKEFDETWADFGTAWENVKFPLGQGPIESLYQQAMQKPLPAAAEAYDTPSLKNLVGLCCELQHNAGDEPFYLTCRSAGQLLGISHVKANKWLRQLERDELLEVTTPGTQNKATRYRYLGSEQVGS